MRPAPPPEPPEYLSTLDVQGAIDLFHVVHLSRPLASDWLEEAGLMVIAADRHGVSVFLRAEPA